MKKIFFIALILLLTHASANAEILFSDDFSGDLSKWNFYRNCTTSQITNSDGNPPPSLLVDDSGNFGCYAETKKKFCYVGRTIVFSADLKQGNAYPADQRRASMYVAEPGMADYDHFACNLGIQGATNPAYPNTAYCAIQYTTSNGNDAIEAIRIGIPNGDGWHNGKIKIREDGKVEFYVDGVLLYTSINTVTRRYDGNAVLTIGGRKSLYDNAKVECEELFQWSYKANIPTPGHSGAMTVADGKLYAIAGYHRGGANEAFDPSTNTWTSKASYPGGPRYGITAATLNGKIYTFCGAHDPNNNDYNTVEQYTPTSNTWIANYATYPKAVHALGAVGVESKGKIYLFGGEHWLGYYCEYYNDVYEFDPQTKTFTPKAPMPEPRCVGFAAELNGKIYIIGGYNSSKTFDSIWVYDIATNSWSVASAKLQLYAAKGGIIKNKIYIVNTRGEGNNDVYEYDPALDTVSKKTNPLTTHRGGSFIGTIGNRLYIASGTIPNTYNDHASTEECIISCDCEQYTLVTLADFIAVAGSKKVTLVWSTEAEIDNAGFNIYRAESEDGDYVIINDFLIPAKGSATEGASYIFIDDTVQNRKTYFYKLEDVDVNGVTTMHGPVNATPRLINLFR